MQLQELYQHIGLELETVHTLDRVGGEIDWSRAAPCLDQLLDIRTARSAYRALKAVLGEDPGGFQLLYCYLECARRAYEDYQRLGIPDQIYIDTMKCFPRFLAECKRETGTAAFDRGWWVYRQTSMQIFRLGALEYEFSKLEEKPVLALHIPTDTSLTAEAVDRSLEEAGTFFQTCFPHYRYDSYICNSWLLSPRLRPFLGRDSHILAFQNRFCLIGDDQTDREFIQWLFQRPQDTPASALPACTSLQRSVKQLLLDGGTIGCTCGVLSPSPGPQRQ